MRIMSPGMRYKMLMHRGPAMRAVVGLREREGSTIMAIRKVGQTYIELCLTLADETRLTANEHALL